MEIYGAMHPADLMADAHPADLMKSGNTYVVGPRPENWDDMSDAEKDRAAESMAGLAYIRGVHEINRRSRLVESALLSGAFIGDLGACEVMGQPDSWHII